MIPPDLLPPGTLPADVPGLPAHVAATLRLFFTNRTRSTLDAYRKGLEAFELWHAARPERPAWAASALVALVGPKGDPEAQGRAYGLALAYRGDMVDARLSSATINARLSVLRSFTSLARMTGAIAWTLEVPNVRASGQRDSRGPGSSNVALMLDRLPDSRKGRRDAAILRLLHDVGLRRSEVATLDMDDVELTAPPDAPGAAPAFRLHVKAKGKHDKIYVPLPPPTCEALATWLGERGPDAGPLFFNLDRSHASARLSGTSLYRLVQEAGAAVGVKARPHGLRHSGITSAARACGGDVRALQEFARHSNLTTTQRYIDDVTGKRDALAAAVAGTVAKKGAAPE